MQLDINNDIVKLCAEGMQLEGQGKANEASELFHRAWETALTNFEKVIAAHYVARHQQNTAEKLKWDQKALTLALKIDNGDTRALMPSLYLNIAKCYEDLKDNKQAAENYHMGLTFVAIDSENGYARMIKNGLNAGLIRLSALAEDR